MNEQAKYYEEKLAYETDSWDLKVALEGGERIVVVDARSPESFGRGHIPGAINIPHRTMSVETTAKIEKSALVVVYCEGIGCNASTKGALRMLNLGFRVKELIGGLDWWRRDGHDVHAKAASDNSSACGCGYA
jgi:rhodanese-related sulfurtransferase